MAGILKIYTVILFNLITCTIVFANNEKNSIYEVSWVADGLITSASTIGVLTIYALSSKIISPSCPCDKNEVNKFDRYAIGKNNGTAYLMSDITVGLAISIPPILEYYNVGFSKEWAVNTLVWGETLALSGALVTIVKHISQRPLPSVYSGDTPELINKPGGYRAFYSGHTATTFASLSFAAMTHRFRNGEQWWPWLGVFLIGGSIGFELMESGRHFPSEILLGASIGTGFGIIVPWLHHNHKKRRISLLPMNNGIKIGLQQNF